MARFDKYFFLGPPEVVNPPLPTNLLLDVYSNALTAYSTVRISSSYTGNLLRVRRSSDNQELDIPYNGSDVLDESVLSAFIGASDAYVTKWYDQSGNGFDQVQASVLNQPKIATAGTILKEGSRVTVFFDGTNDFTSTTRTINVNGLTEFTQSIVTTPVQATAASVNIQRSQQAITASSPWGIIGQSLYKTAAQWRFGTGQVNNYNSLPININKQCIYSVFKTNTLEEPRLDNTNLASTNRLATLANNNIFTELGRSQSAYFQGNLSQAIMWMSSYSSVKADLHDTINAIYASY
jgi:hypothetical protein